MTYVAHKYLRATLPAQDALVDLTSLTFSFGCFDRFERGTSPSDSDSSEWNGSEMKLFQMSAIEKKIICSQVAKRKWLNHLFTSV